MPQQLDDLIFDRTQSDVSRVQSLTQKMIAGTATEAEREEWLGGKMKGAWNASDLNRIEAWTAYLYDVLLQYGYTAVITPRNPDRPGGGILPDGYTQLEYIQSSGTQYIDTGFKPNQDTRTVMDFELTSAYSSIRGIFGVRDTASGTAPNQFVFWNNAAAGFRTDYFGTQQTISGVTVQARNTVNKNKNVTTIGGETATNTAATGQCTYSLVLFATNSAGSIEYYSPLLMYSCKIYDDGVLIRYFYPCKNPAGTVGLYDIVSNVFYGNAGTGTFAAGPEIMPDESAPSDELWIESDIPYRSEIDRIRRNVDALQTGFQSLADWRDIIYNNTMDFNQANALEWDLQRIYDWLQAMASGFLTKQANTLFMVAGGVFNN